MKWFLFSFLSLISLAVGADNGSLFTVPLTDRSLMYLGEIFGGNVGPLTLSSTSINPIISSLFQSLNNIVMMIGVAIVSYIGVIGTINTAHEGEMMGKKFSSIWIPMRSTLGMLLMIPSTGSGYSVIQVFVMWIVLQGIGAANSLWSVVLDQLHSGASISGSVQGLTPTAIAPTAKAVLNSVACMEYINNSNPKNLVSNNYGVISVQPYVINASSSQILPNCPSGSGDTASWQVMTGGNNSALNGVCGYFCGTVSGNGNVSGAEFASNIAQGVTALYSSWGSILPNIVNTAISSSNYNSVDFPDGYYNAVIGSYNSAVSSQIVNSGSALADQTYQNAQADGWIMAGAYYRSMTQGQASINTAVTPPSSGFSIPSGSGGTISGGSSLLSNQLGNSDKANLGNLLGTLDSRFGPPASGATTALNNSALNTGGGGAFSLITSALSSLLSTIANGFGSVMNDTNNGQDPLIALATLGGNLMNVAESAWIGLMLGFMALLFVAGICGAESPAGIAMSTTFVIISPWVTMVFVSCYTAGASMAIYLPLIPYVIFSTGAIGWFIAVIEAMVGAPILALALIHPSGDELGKTGAGLSILSNVFLRPALMILGFIFASRLLNASIHFINYGFNWAYSSSVPGAVSSSILGGVLPIIFYISLVMAITNKAFTLVHLIPDQILRWMGGHAESHGSSMSDTQSAIKQSTESGSNAAHETQKGVSDSASKSGADRDKAAKEGVANRAQQEGGSGMKSGGLVGAVKAKMAKRDAQRSGGNDGS